MTQKNTPPTSPAGALGVDVEELVARCREVRQRSGLSVAGWTARSVGAAVGQAVIERGVVADVAVRALLLVAVDPATRSPGRLACVGPWWEAAHRALLQHATARRRGSWLSWRRGWPRRMAGGSGCSVELARG